MSNDIRIGNVCENCDDGSGQSVFPYYGTAPEVPDPKRMPPPNFVPDTSSPEHIDGPHGIYLYCPVCMGASFNAHPTVGSKEPGTSLLIGQVTSIEMNARTVNFKPGTCSLSVVKGGE